MKLFIAILFLSFSAAQNTFAAFTEEEHDAYLSAALRGKMARFERLDQKIDDVFLRALALAEAIDGRQKVIIEYLLSRYDFSEETLSMALETAIKQGSKDFVRMLKAKGAHVVERIPVKISFTIDDYIPKWQSVVASLAVTVAMVGINLINDRYITPRYNAWKYGNCAICQESLTKNIISLKCHHHFHGACLTGWVGNINKDIDAYNTWREALAATLQDLHPLIQSLEIIAKLQELDPGQAEVYMNNLRTGVWSGATLKCPTCRTPLN